MPIAGFGTAIKQRPRPPTTQAKLVRSGPKRVISDAVKDELITAPALDEGDIEAGHLCRPSAVAIWLAITGATVLTETDDS